MARRAAQRVEDGNTDDPSRPDNIPAQAGDDDGGLVDINGDKAGVVDVNAPARDDDARSDEEKETERRAAREQEEIRSRQTERDPVRDEDDDGHGMTRKMRRRVERERALRRQSDERVQQLTAENRQLKEGRVRTEGGNADEITKTIGQLKTQLNEIKTKLAAAIEAGNTTDQLALTIELSEVQAKIQLQERDLTQAKAAPPQQEQQEQTQTRPPLVQDWMTANRRWWNMPANRSLQESTIELDKQIKADIKDGELDFDEYSEEHMDHLTKLVAKEAKKLGLDVDIRDFNGEVYDANDDDEDDDRDEPDNRAPQGRRRTRDVKASGNGARPPQGGQGGREGRRGNMSDLELAKQGKARLTDQDYAQMRVFKLDPNDPKVRQRFAKERVRTILTEAQKNARGAR